MKKQKWLSLILATAMSALIVLPAAASADTSVPGTTYSATDSTTAPLSPLAQQLQDYTAALEPLGVYEDKAIDTYRNNNYVNAANRKTTFLAFNNIIVPNYTKFVQGLKAIQTPNSDLKYLHYKYTRGAYLQLEGLMLFKQSLYSQKINYKLFNQANDKLAAGRKLIDQFNTEFEAYANKLAKQQ
ncbi:hypothetical protein Q5741_03585 [Paenibacillus sp. JX-17]|uniref:Uncharacterized protein n=1 Tax=Paenibacillus lacisoli TaxID=3064525 RepID=A0ABT9C8A6_9BACL|nr:hypothetical protein [Paenibacillus sp. JX-17]MDO7905493.1 hypothetical protein [Paenibacillus sp. JX-17]